MSLMTEMVSGNPLMVLAMLAIFSVTGGIGNLLVIVVYAVKHDRLTGTLFILVLAVTDFLACITLIPATLGLEYMDWKLTSNVLCKGYYFLNNSFIPFSSLLITCIAFDRYFCICHPFRKLMTLSRAKRVIFALVVMAILQGSCATFMVRLQRMNTMNQTLTKFIELTNSTSDMSLNVPTDENVTYECTDLMYVNKTGFEKVIYQLIQKSQTVDYILCIISVFVLYILIYRTVAKASQKKRKLVSIRPKSTTVHQEIYETDISQVTERKPTHISGQFSSPSDPSCQESTSIDYNAQFNNSMQNGDKETCLKTAPVEGSGAKWSSKEHVEPSSNTLGPDSSAALIDPPSYRSIDDRVNDFSSNRLPYAPLRCTCNSNVGVKSLRSGLDPITLQNMKTASMLFVVTMVYIFSFLPAMLMVNQVVPINLIVFYLYYVNNAINPFIYGFMNPNFRADIRSLLRRLYKR